MKQFSVEEIKRLVPEAEYIESLDIWEINGDRFYDDGKSFYITISTRAQLEVALSALTLAWDKASAGCSDNEMSIDSFKACQMVEEDTSKALARIKQLGER